VARYTEGFSHIVTSMTAPVASGWSGCRVGLAPTGKRRLSRRTPEAVDVADQLALWVHHYNWHRSHESLHGDTPIDRVCQRADKTPLWAAVSDAYDPAKEHIQIRQHAVEMALRTLDRSESSPSVTKGEHRAYSIILARAAASDKKSRPPLTSSRRSYVRVLVEDRCEFFESTSKAALSARALSVFQLFHAPTVPPRFHGTGCTRLAQTRNDVLLPSLQLRPDTAPFRGTRRCVSPHPSPPW
jgi:hypothetical protein